MYGGKHHVHTLFCIIHMGIIHILYLYIVHTVLYHDGQTYDHYTVTKDIMVTVLCSEGDCMCYTQVSTILCVSDSYSWSSYLKTGVLVAHGDETLTFRMEDTVLLTSHLSEKGRGAELSELIVFNGRLYTVDDRSGIGETAFTCT